jgi:hypothetical protein
MKKKIIQLLVLSFILFSCKKSSVTSNPIGNSLIGKWTYTQYWYSIGSGGEWHAVKPTNQTIEFQSDGTFISAESFLKEANTFEIIDSATVKFLPATNASGSQLMSYKIDTIKRELTMSPINPVCIEGCANRFKR